MAIPRQRALSPKVSVADENLPPGVCVTGYSQQGVTPSPFDRAMAIKMTIAAVSWMTQQLGRHLQPDGTITANTSDTAVMTGILNQNYKFTPLRDLIVDTDFENEIPKSQWWMKLRPLLHIISRYKVPLHWLGPTTEFLLSASSELLLAPGVHIRLVLHEPACLWRDIRVLILLGHHNLVVVTWGREEREALAQLLFELALVVAKCLWGVQPFLGVDAKFVPDWSWCLTPGSGQQSDL
uniref:Uncharacterized protein n=1 Tax=Timema cristinae TaxID=61476 RepID=A0A7R9CMQ4_TIMCR|nr:unnamed protein product [Timema cristinae]